MQEPRDLKQRTQDTLSRLIYDTDAWVATAGASSGVHMVPLCFHYESSGTLLMATPADNQTARNWITTKRARISIGQTRDVVMINATVRILTPQELTPAVMDGYAAAVKWDPRDFPELHVYARLTPVKIQAWRELNEIPGRDIMLNGRWLYPE